MGQTEISGMTANEAIDYLEDLLHEKERQYQRIVKDKVRFTDEDCEAALKRIIQIGSMLDKLYSYVSDDWLARNGW